MTAVTARTIALDPHIPASEAFGLVLCNLADAIDANWPGAVEGADAECLHDLRVAVRRTRAVLAAAKQVLPADVRAQYRTEFKWLGTVTGPVRDLDVYLSEWEAYTGDLDEGTKAALDVVRDHLLTSRQSAQDDLVRALRSTRYRRLMDGWREALASSAEGGRDGRKPIRRVAVRRIESAQRAVLEHGRAITPQAPGRDLHELRKDAKKLRYLIECFGGLFDGRRRQAFVKQLKALQDNLGEHQDTEVHVAELTELSNELDGQEGVDAETFVAMGRLIEHLDRRRTVARAEFAARFAEYDTKKTARALEKLTKTAVT